MSTCYVGIDPAFRKDGFVVCIIDECNTADFKTFESFMFFLDWLFEAPDNALWCIENSNLQDITFDTTGSKFIACKKSRDVGKNMAISQATVDICRKKYSNSNVLELSPKQKGGKIENDTIFRAIAKQHGITLLNYKGKVGEQDKRDAFMLAIRAKQWKTNT